MSKLVAPASHSTSSRHSRESGNLPTTRVKTFNNIGPIKPFRITLDSSIEQGLSVDALEAVLLHQLEPNAKLLRWAVVEVKDSQVTCEGVYLTVK